MENTRNSAIDYLNERIFAIQPSARIRLGIRYRIPDWFNLALQSLLSGTIASLTTEDMEQIPASLFMKILQILRRLEVHRVRLEVVPPEAVHTGLKCISDRHTQCQQGWVSYWMEEISPCLLRSVSPWTGNNILAHLQRSPPTRMLSECATATVRAIVTDLSPKILSDVHLIDAELPGLVEECQGLMF